MSKRRWDEPDESAAAKMPRTDAPAESSKFDAAAEVAARIAAQYGKGGGTAASGKGGAGAGAEASASSTQRGREHGDPEFVHDIEINDMRNRYMLTKGPTQHQIHEETGADVTTKGQWYPDKTLATERDPPLYLHITGTSKEILDRGIAAVQRLIDQELGQTTDGRRPDREQRFHERRRWPEQKVPIEIEPLRNFNVRAKVVGPGGLFVKFIQQETGARVQIKGQGSGFVETDTGREADEPMHINVAGPDEQQVDRAAEMARDLVLVVGQEWRKAKDVLEQHQAMQYQQQSQQLYGQYMGGAGGAAPGGYGDQGWGQQQAYGAPMPSGDAPPPPPPPDGSAPPLPPADGAPPPPPGGAAPPPPPQGAPPAAPAGGQQSPQQYQYGQQGGAPQQPQGQQGTAEQWAAYWNSLDPAQQAYYQQYYAAYQQPGAYSASPGQPGPGGAGTPGGAGGDSGRREGQGAYGAVPPPPGL